uniref:Major facilitator superfamily (MFS) profile domain-containing protein n=1 Tax=Ciona savignyi TaxID=51511 RepID=H2ZF04_CIOSA
MPQHATELGASPSIIGLYGSIYGAIQLFSSPIIGHIGDTHGRIPVLYFCLIIAASGYCISSLVTYSLLLLSLLRFVAGIFKHTQDLCRNCLADIAVKKEKTKAIGQFNALSNIGFIVGPAISGYISNWLGLATGISVCFFLCGVLFFLNAIMVWFILWPNAPSVMVLMKQNLKKREEKSLFARIMEIDWKVHSGLLLSRFLAAFAVLIYRSSFVLGVKNLYPHLTPAEVGYLVSYNGTLGLVIGLCIGSVSACTYYAGNEEKMQMHASLLIPVGFAIIAFSNNLSLMMAGMAILVVGTAVSRACGVILTTSRSRPNEAGKLLGLSASILSIARSAGPFVAGIAQEFSFAAPAYVSFVTSVLALLVYYSKVYRVHEPPVHEPPTLKDQ